jgi:hypothetical protein
MSNSIKKLKLQKITLVNGHISETVEATDNYNHFLDTIGDDE